MKPLRTYRRGPNDTRQRVQYLPLEIGDLVEVTVHLDVVVSYDTNPRARVSVFTAFDEILLVEPAYGMQKVSMVSFPPYHSSSFPRAKGCM